MTRVAVTALTPGLMPGDVGIVDMMWVRFTTFENINVNESDWTRLCCSNLFRSNSF